jgi:hypothetical protein
MPMNMSRYSYVFSEPDRPPVTNYPDVEDLARINRGLGEAVAYAIAGRFLLDAAHAAHLDPKTQDALVAKGNALLQHAAGANV